MAFAELSNEQRIVFDKMVKEIEQGTKCLSLTGPAGTGKTFLLNKFVDMFDGKCYCVAFTGVAATLNKIGTTCHKFLCATKISMRDIFKDDFLNWLKAKNISFNPFMKGMSDKQAAFANMLRMQFLEHIIKDEEETRNEQLDHEIESKKETKFVKLLEKLQFEDDYSEKILLVDESSMLPRYFARLFLRMGFKCVIFVGDKYQLPPVIHNKEYMGSYEKELPKMCPKFELTEIVRQQNKEVLEFLRDACRETGEKKQKAIDGLNNYFHSHDNIIDDPDTRNRYKKEPEQIQLYYTNKKVHAANEDDMEGYPKSILYPQVVLKKKWTDIKMRFNWLQLAHSEEDLIERIENHYKGILPRAILKHGYCMNLMNIDGGPQNGHVVPVQAGNIEKSEDEHIWPTRVEGRKDKWEYKGATMQWRDALITFDVQGCEKLMHTSNMDFFSIVFPCVQHSFAFTFHKSQGRTFEKGCVTGIYLNEYGTNPLGAVYVALTRNKDFADIRLHGDLKYSDFDYQNRNMEESPFYHRKPKENT